MSQRSKKKPAFFSLKLFNGQKSPEDPGTPKTPTLQSPSFQFTKSSSRTTSPARIPSATEPKPRKLSAGGIKELVQCPLCLEVLHNPKMLPCQHTFCMACLLVYAADLPVIDCPICRTRIQVKGPSFVNDLPSNLYIDSILQLMGVKSEPEVLTPRKSLTSVELLAGGVKCSHCQTLCDNSDVTACEHCKMNFCQVCWSQHLDDMRIQIGSILKQLDSAAGRLEHKIEYYKDQCERLTEQITITAEEKINAINRAKERMLEETVELQKNGDITATTLNSSLKEARDVATQAMNSKRLDNDKNQVTTFMNLHHNAIQLLSDVSKWEAESFTLDKDNFRLERDDTTADAEADDPVPLGTKENNPLENEETLVLHYRSRNFIPHYIWRKTAHPCGVSISPFDDHLYVCGMDNHCVLVVQRSQAKIVSRLMHDEMLCPVQIAFMKSTEEIYVTDKWKHCVHVFSKDGDYLRAIGQKGSRVGTFRSPEGIAIDDGQGLVYVVDTGNDRVQVLEPDGKFVDQIGVLTKQQTSSTSSVWDMKGILCTELNAPTSVAITKDRVIVLDSGNRRVKIYNKQDKSKILEFGSLGDRKGQFKHPEVLAVDPMGFILVGDSGNCRVQVFKPTGQIVRVFGGLGTEMGRFGWISGIHVTKQLDIIISDTKNHVVNFF